MSKETELKFVKGKTKRLINNMRLFAITLIEVAHLVAFRYFELTMCSLKYSILILVM